jgi:hypothetical protein
MVGDGREAERNGMGGLPERVSGDWVVPFVLAARCGDVVRGAGLVECMAGFFSWGGVSEVQTGVWCGMTPGRVSPAVFLHGRRLWPGVQGCMVCGAKRDVDASLVGLRQVERAI